MNEIDTNRFESYRPLMFSIAYRMLGSATEAEDIVQEAYLRYQGTDTNEIVSHKAFLSTVVTRLCLNHLQSAQTQRETYVGPWLPEPILAEQISIPAHEAELHESISIAFLTILEQLSPLERAVFLLREVFDYEYGEIAEIIGKEETACRQLFSRARKHITEHRPRYKPSPEMHRQILDQFIRATGTGELDGLIQLLSDDVVMWADGGGKTRGAALHPLYGRNAVGQFILASVRLAPASLHTEITEVNGEPAVVIRANDRVFLVLFIEAYEGQIREIRIVGNPDKLNWVNEDNES